MIIDEDGAQSANMAGTGLAVGQARYNLSPLAYSKPNQRIGTNDMIAYLAVEAPKNGERFELSATAVNPRRFPAVATASQGELLNGITNRSGNSSSTTPSSVLLVCSGMCLLDWTAWSGKKALSNEAVTARSNLVNLQLLLSVRRHCRAHELTL
jgi:hypothetical protein